uniref:Vacuolar ATPase assembly protein VMA22 n=2 Tax=Pyxicephalus adspersus TaxID=30357 RepID=A0AAV2ZWL8_PYXAD|nr:TPA: hypothetical protein GDO54_017879 [Pyxicephalus adspersus]
MFQVEKIESEQRKSVKRADAREVKTIGAVDQVVRHRGQKVTTEIPKHPKVEVNEKQKSQPSNDPLRWFGVLVPQSLRQAQSTYCQGIQLAAEVASLQNSINENRKQYQALLTDKHQLQSQAFSA